MLRSWHSEVLLSKAQKLFRQNRLSESIALYRQALEFNPQSAGAWLHLAIALSENSDDSSAIESVNWAIGLKPRNPVNYMFMGLFHYDGGAYDKAVQAFEKAGVLDSGYHYASFLRHLTDFTLGRFEEAYSHFHNNYHWGLDFQSRLLIVCEIYLKGHDREAHSFFQSDLTLKGAAGRSFNNKISRFLVNVRFGFLKWVHRVFYANQQTGKSGAALLRGKEHFAKGDPERAIAEFGQVLDYPDTRHYDKALRQLTEIHLGIGDFNNFLQYAKLIPEYQPTFAFLDNPSSRPSSPAQYPALHLELLVVLGIVYYETGEISRAQDALLIATRLDPKNYLNYYYLGLCELAVIGNRDHPENLTMQDLRAARLWFKKALAEVNPGIVPKRAAETMRVFRAHPSQTAETIFATRN